MSFWRSPDEMRHEMELKAGSGQLQRGVADAIAHPVFDLLRPISLASGTLAAAARPVPMRGTFAPRPRVGADRPETNCHL
jgi:hypothetical protein